MNKGLVNWIGCGCSFSSRFASENVPGQIFRYGTPSNSMSASRQPPIGTNPKEAAKAASKQKVSSSPGGSLTPEDMQAPPSLATFLQYSKCPISSENAMP